MMKQQIETKRLVLTLQTPAKKTYETYSYSIHRCDSQPAIGTALAVVDRDEEAVQLTVVINDECRRQGFGLEAGDALVEELVLCFPKLEIFAVVPDNSLAANAYCRRLGFEWEYSDYLSDKDETQSNFYFM